MKRLFKKLFLLSSYEHTGDAEKHRQLVMINSITLFAIVVLIIIGTISLLRGDTIVALLDIVVCGVLILCIAYLRSSGKTVLPILIGMGFITVLFSYMFITGGANNTGFAWYYTYPAFALYIMGRKQGAVATLVLFIPAFIYLIILWPMETSRYSQEFTIRFIPSVFCVFLFSYLFETTRLKTQKKLEAKQRELEDSISALREKELELQKAHKGLEQRVENRTRELQVANEILKVEIEERKRSEESRKALESQLIRAKKMEAIGILAGGVAHDLNNILSGIVSYPELLLHQMPADSTLRKPLETVRQSGKKAAAMVRDLLTMARRGVNIEAVVQINDVINEFLGSPEYDTLAKSYPATIVTSSLAPDLNFIKGSAIHVEKTIMNLVTNAFEAFDGKGEISITTQNCILDQPVQGYEEIPPGKYVKLTVADTGSGISASDVQHIFEPFYTKKVMGRSGTGLGMSVVWATIKDHNGYIDIKSVMGEGTTVMLFFNGMEKPPELRPQNIVLENYSGSNQLILVVDDQAEQRQIARDTLCELGYAVDTVSSGEEAMAYLEQNRPDLIILDMIMGQGMDGLDTYIHIKEKLSSQRVIIASGYSENDRLHEARRLGVLNYIAKPYSLKDIAKMVYEVLQTG